MARAVTSRPMPASLRLNLPALILFARTDRFFPHDHPQASDSSPGAGRDLDPHPHAATGPSAAQGRRAQAHPRRSRRTPDASAPAECGSCLNVPFRCGDPPVLGSPQKGSSSIVLSPSLRVVLQRDRPRCSSRPQACEQDLRRKATAKVRPDQARSKDRRLLAMSDGEGRVIDPTDAIRAWVAAPAHRTESIRWTSS